MTTQANCSFKITGWDEEPYAEFENDAKLTRATVTQDYEGDLVGQGAVEFLMSHTGKGTANFVGIERVTGSLSGVAGSFLIQHVGTFGAGGAVSEWTILPDSGTGGLAGISGQGGYTAASEAVSMPFRYELGSAG